MRIPALADAETAAWAARGLAYRAAGVGEM
jgi:hypothetical protein